MNEPGRETSINGRREAQARRGLTAWAGFPADHQPRPLILLSAATQPGGFPDGQKKMAFINGVIEAVPDFPASILEALRDRPRPTNVAPLVLISAVPGEREFVTDRGRVQLPAWCVRAQDVPAPIWVLDPAVSRRRWRPRGLEHRGWNRQEATLGVDGRTLTMSFPGSPEAYTSYPGTRILEAGNAVAVVPITKELVTGWRTAIGKTRQVSATLDRPLGSRVLLDGSGSPVMVSVAPGPTA